ncbi:sulfurtransferase [Streptomyces sp. AS58]|uniref:rhodanese-like domain-containing protein n=1 Tax=Streptomyces sp. AS58 TaxID=1519489 RepID=UPI0006AEF7F1|nr:rhodanese-like domain-containing protein [Streptomyces sp. AS58]KOV53588.1 sulfurtransferase [Streptomyces sp. AS58]
MQLFGRNRSGPGRVTVQEAAARTGHTQSAESGAPAVLLDVRESSEWRAGHAPRAVHLPLTALATGAELPAGTQERPVVVICRSGHRSLRAAELLHAQGVEAVDVVGGMQNWAAAGLPVVDSLGGDGTIA